MSDDSYIGAEVVKQTPESKKLNELYDMVANENAVQRKVKELKASTAEPQVRAEDLKVLLKKLKLLIKKVLSKLPTKLTDLIEGMFNAGGAGTPGGDSALASIVSKFSEGVGSLFSAGSISSSLGDMVSQGLSDLAKGEPPSIENIVADVDEDGKDIIVKRSKQSKQAEKKTVEEKESKSNWPKGLEELKEAVDKLSDAFGGDAAGLISKAKDLAGGGGSSGAPSASGVEVGSAFRATLETTEVAIDGVTVEAATARNLTKVIKVPATTIGEEFPGITSETGLITERANYSESGIFDRPVRIKETFTEDDMGTRGRHDANIITLKHTPINIIGIKGYVEGYKYGKLPVTIVSKQEWGNIDDSYGDGYYEFDKKEVTIHGSYIPRHATLNPDGRAHSKNGVVFEVIYIYLDTYDPRFKQTFNNVATLVKSEPNFRTEINLPAESVAAQVDKLTAEFKEIGPTGQFARTQETFSLAVLQQKATKEGHTEWDSTFWNKYSVVPSYNEFDNSYWRTSSVVSSELNGDGDGGDGDGDGGDGDGGAAGG